FLENIVFAQLETLYRLSSPSMKVTSLKTYGDQRYSLNKD
ncbi:10139_t:CDS:1, partial [Scutellospora calospora]